MYLGDIRKATSYILESLAIGFTQSPVQEWTGYGTSAAALNTVTVTDTSWANSDYLEAIDWACKTATIALELTPRMLTAITVALGSNAAPIPLPAPLKILNVLDHNMNIIPPSSQKLEDVFNPGWRSLTGTPTGWFAENANLIRLNRLLPAASPITVQILEPPVSIPLGATQDAFGNWSASNPIQSGLDTDQIDPRLPDNVQKSLRMGASYYLLNQSGDMEDMAKADTLLKKFYAELGVGND